MRQKVPEPICCRLDITLTGLFRLPVLRQHRLALCSPGGAVVGISRVSAAPHIRALAGPARWQIWRARIMHSDRSPSPAVPNPLAASLLGRLPSRLRHLSQAMGSLARHHFGGCRPGLFAHLSTYSATWSWLGRAGGVGSLGLRGCLISLSIGISLCATLPGQPDCAMNNDLILFRFLLTWGNRLVSRNQRQLCRVSRLLK